MCIEYKRSITPKKPNSSPPNGSIVRNPLAPNRASSGVSTKVPHAAHPTPNIPLMSPPRLKVVPERDRVVLLLRM